MFTSNGFDEKHFYENRLDTDSMEKAQHESDCEFSRRETPGIERKLFRLNFDKSFDASLKFVWERVCLCPNSI